MAFQLVDDLLDLTGREEVLGKPIASDLREGKMTLPIIHLLEPPVRRVRERDRRDRARAAVTPGALGRMSSAMPRRAPRRSITRSGRPATTPRRAKDSLDALPASPERDALLALPDYVLSRDR